MPLIDLPIESLLAGRPAFIAPGVLSAMGKSPVEGPVMIGWTGLDGDTVADPVHHGGHDKAVHLYPQDHYPWWRERIGAHPLLEAPGAFGENIAVRGLVEAQVCLGDRFSLGNAAIELSHGRQPCSKLNHRFGRQDILATVVQSGRAGWYFRVLAPGEARTGDRLTLVERPFPEWPMDRVFSLIVAGGHKSEPDAVRTLAGMPVLAEAWRARAASLVSGRANG